MKKSKYLKINTEEYLNDNAFKTTKGCPQGGCASPSLWRIGMNNLLNNIDKVKNVSAIAFADDLLLLVNSNDILSLEKLINNVWTIIDEWCVRAELQLNLDKTNFMLLKKQKLSRDLFIKDFKIKFVNEFKYLGIYIDKNLNFGYHVNYLKDKIDLVLLRINKLLKLNANIQLKYKMNLYHTVCLAVLTYASKVWFDRIKHKTSYLQKFRLMQNRFLKNLTKLYKITSNEKLLGLETIINLTKIRYSRNMNVQQKNERIDEPYTRIIPSKLSFISSNSSIDASTNRINTSTNSIDSSSIVNGSEFEESINNWKELHNKQIDILKDLIKSNILKSREVEKLTTENQSLKNEEKKLNDLLNYQKDYYTKDVQLLKDKAKEKDKELDSANLKVKKLKTQIDDLNTNIKDEANKTRKLQSKIDNLNMQIKNKADLEVKIRNQEQIIKDFEKKMKKQDFIYGVQMKELKEKDEEKRSAILKLKDAYKSIEKKFNLSEFD